MYFLLKMWIFQPAMLVYQRVFKGTRFESQTTSPNQKIANPSYICHGHFLQTTKHGRFQLAGRFAQREVGRTASCQRMGLHRYPGHVRGVESKGLTTMPWFQLQDGPQLSPREYNWLVLIDEQMSNRWLFSFLNGEQMSNWVGVKHLPDNMVVSKNRRKTPKWMVKIMENPIRMNGYT